MDFLVCYAYLTQVVASCLAFYWECQDLISLNHYFPASGNIHLYLDYSEIESAKLTGTTRVSLLKRFSPARYKISSYQYGNPHWSFFQSSKDLFSDGSLWIISSTSWIIRWEWHTMIVWFVWKSSVFWISRSCERAKFSSFLAQEGILQNFRTCWSRTFFT